MISRLILYFVCLLLSVIAQAQSAPADALQLARVLNAHEYVIADFSQQRRIAGLKKPVQSQGTLLLWRKKLLLWQVRAPVQSLQLIRFDGTKARSSRAGSKVPAQLNQMLGQIFSGDENQLRQNFTLAQNLHADGHWQLTLTPKAARIARVLKAITISGGQQAISAVMIEQSTSVLEVQFAAPETPRQLTPYWRAIIEQN